MIPQTPQERIACYQKAIDLYEEKKKNMYTFMCNGMCIVLMDYVCDEWNTSTTVFNFMSTYFPELWSQKPESLNDWQAWYPETEIDKRIEHLQIAIEKCKDIS